MVSIVVPVYNGANSILRTVKSLLWQSFTDWECIIVNDGSTDGTKDCLDSLMDSRFRIVHFERNRGRGAARKVGVELARGEFIAFQDADDWSHPDRLKLLLCEFATCPDCVLVSSAMVCFGDSTDRVMRRGPYSRIISRYNGEKLPSFPASMVRAELAKKYNFNEKLKFSEDYDFLNLLLNDNQYIVLPDLLYFYSEFDSISKKRTLNTYKKGVRDSFKRGNILSIIKELSKYTVFICLYPILTLDKIVKMRCQELEEEDRSSFYKLKERLDKE